MQKVIRLLTEKDFAFRLLVLAALAGCAFMLFAFSETKRKAVHEIARRKAQQVELVRQAERTIDNLPIKGVVIKDNSPLIMIGDEIYKEGDSIGDYVIDRINEHALILRKRITGELKMIQISEG